MGFLSLHQNAGQRFNLGKSTRSAFWCNLKNFFFAKFCRKFLAFFSGFFAIKNIKNAYTPGFGVRSTPNAGQNIQQLILTTEASVFT